jgi:hypothetical protein
MEVFIDGNWEEYGSRGKPGSKQKADKSQAHSILGSNEGSAAVSVQAVKE